MIPTKIDDVFYFMPDADLSPNLHGIWRVNDDGTDLKQLCDDISEHYYIFGDYIYYNTIGYDVDFGDVYRIKLDGSGKQKLASDDTTVHDVVGDNIIMVQLINSTKFKYYVLNANGVEHVLFNTAQRFSGNFKLENHAYYISGDRKKLYRLDYETFEFEFFARIKQG